MDKRLSNRKKRVPNFRLREAREQRGLAHKDVADLIGLPDSHTVGRWERGESFPQPHYRQKLTHLFGKSAEELGLVKARFDELTQQSEAPPEPSESRQTPQYIWKIPHPFSSFIGREQDIVTVSNLLKRTSVHLLTLLGPGGVGKTRLSIQIANTMREHFIGGVCFVSLASIGDPMLVLPTIAQAFGMQESGSQSIIEQIKSVLRDTSFLLVLDNFEQVVTAAPLVEELLTACPGLKVLVTSRTVLNLQAEHEYPIAPLVTPDPAQLTAPGSLIQYPAVALFVQRAQTILPTFQLTQSNAQAVAKICMRLDGLPLAIELAAARIKLLPPQALLAQLAQDFQLLKSELRNLPVRQHTLYNTIKWSYDLLDEQEQEKQNLRAALTYLIQQKEAERSLRYCEAFGKFCGLRGYWREEQYWLKTVLALPWSLEARAIRARVLRRAGHLAYRLRDLVLARSLLEESVALSRVQDDKQNLAGALVNLGWVLYRQNDISIASTLLHESVAAARVSGDRWALANALESLGRLAHFQNQTSEAHQLLQESVKLSRELGDKESLARFLTTLVSIELAQNHTPQAAALAQESFALAQELGTKPLIALVLDSLGEVALASGEYERAAQCFEERIMLARELGDRPTIAMKQLDLGEIALAKGDLTSAITYIEESLRFFREQDDIPNIAAALGVLGDIKRMQGKLSEATTLYKEASLLKSA